MRFRGNASADAADEKRPGEGERCQRRPTGSGDGDEQGAFVGSRLRTYGFFRRGRDWVFRDRDRRAGAGSPGAADQEQRGQAGGGRRGGQHDGGALEGRQAAPSPAACAPRTVTRIATPSTMPTWRAMVTMPEPVANRLGGTAETAALTRVGSVRPTPVPVSSMPGSMWAG